jgi:hypothetical protein
VVAGWLDIYRDHGEYISTGVGAVWNKEQYGTRGSKETDECSCKGTSDHSLTSPVSHYVYMYSPRSLYMSDHIYTTPTSLR